MRTTTPATTTSTGSGQGAGPNGGIPSFEQKLQTFHDPAYSGSYADITGVSSKPIALVEAAASSGTDAERADWTADMFATLASGRYPRLAELSWWNSYDIATRLDLLPATQGVRRRRRLDTLRRKAPVQR
jgi:hypothetical protein